MRGNGHEMQSWEILTEYTEKMFTVWLSTGAGCGCEIHILGGFQLTKQNPGQTDVTLELSSAEDCTRRLLEVLSNLNYK